MTIITIGDPFFNNLTYFNIQRGLLSCEKMEVYIIFASKKIKSKWKK